MSAHNCVRPLECGHLSEQELEEMQNTEILVGVNATSNECKSAASSLLECRAVIVVDGHYAGCIRGISPFASFPSGLRKRKGAKCEIMFPIDEPANPKDYQVELIWKGVLEHLDELSKSFNGWRLRE